MKKKPIIIIFLALVLALAGCGTKSTEGLVFTKFYDGDYGYISVTGGGRTDYTKVTLPDTHDAAYVEVIGERAFLNCRDLTEINVPPHVSLISFQAFKNCESLPSVILPASLMSIGPEAFSGCKSLTSITIPENVVYIDIQAFQSCITLKNVVLPAFVEGVTNRDFLERIGDRVFSDCFALSYIPLPEGITLIGFSAFENCLTLKNVEFPARLVSIGTRAYYNCRSIEKIELPAGLKSVGVSAFFGCTSLSEVVINAAPDVPDGEDGEEPKEETEPEIPQEELIGDGAFFGCPIKKLTVYRPEVINFAAFDFGGKDLTGLEIKVLSEVYESYLADPDWGALAEYIVSMG